MKMYGLLQNYKIYKNTKLLVGPYLQAIER